MLRKIKNGFKKAYNGVKRTICNTYNGIANFITKLTVIATKLGTVILHLYLLIDIFVGIVDNNYTIFDVIVRGLLILLLIKINKEVS